MPDKIGLIAGSGQFPILFAQAAQQKGWRVHAAAYYDETDAALANHADSMEWFYLGQLKRLIRYFQRHGVTQAVMLGAIRKTRMFTNVRPDIKAIALIAGMRSTHDDAILRKFAEVLEKEGIQIRPSTMLLPHLLAPEGIWTRRRPTHAENQDLRLGWRIALEIGRLDVGQCVVVGGGAVLAVEAIEGTDAAIRRGGSLGKGHAVVVKVCKPNQDLRFDIPAVGLETIETMHAVNVQALAILADKVVAFDRDAMIERADAYHMAVVALKEDQFEEHQP
jgi:UDP-2,3-diacylglucosamine hydrolase